LPVPKKAVNMISLFASDELRQKKLESSYSSRYKELREKKSGKREKKNR
jgi:hypothetical protein